MINNDTLDFLKTKLNGFIPDTAIVLGSGLGNFTDLIKNPIIIPYADIPGAPKPTVKGHQGRLCAGIIGKHKVICLQGRTHLYEGMDPRTILVSTQQLKDLGAKRFIATNAAGSLRTDMPAGSLMLIEDHINFSGKNPLVGAMTTPNFPDMSAAYDIDMRQKILDIAARENIRLFSGVYIMALGPNYETPAEVRMFRQFGADAVGMSTVPEVITAVQSNLKVLGISVISNLGAGLSSEKLNHSDVLQIVEAAGKKLSYLLQKFLEEE